MRNFRTKQVNLVERIIAGLSYVTMGMAGFIWLIICAFTKTPLTSFLKYHIFQSFFLVMGFFLLNIFVGLIVNILGIIPLINIIVYKVLYFFTTPLVFGYSIINAFILVVMLYLVLTSLQGKYSYIPWISNIINSNVGRN